VANVAKKKTASTKKAAAGPGDEADPRFFPVAKALAKLADFSLMESKSGALRGMMRNGKSFGMSSHGRFILKLNEERAAALIATGTAKPFQHGPRVIATWVEIVDAKADWVKLAKEAYELAAAGKPAKKPPPKKAPARR
jgi:TfoX/Sxy family transcriptional regulator of competence genes